MGWQDAPLVGSQTGAWDAAPLVGEKEKEKEKKKEKPPEPDFSGEPIAGALEPLLTMATGMVAKPVSEAMALGPLALELTGLGSGGDPRAFQKHVQDTFTYEPRTQLGKSEYNPLNMIPKAIGSVFEAIGEGSGNIAKRMSKDPVYSDMIKNAVKEGVMQVPQFLGIKGPAGGVAARTILQGETPILGARAWMQGALKPSRLARETGDAADAITALLEDSRTITQGGANKYTREIDALHNQVNNVIRNSTERISPWDVVDRLDPEMARASRSALPIERMREVMRSGDEWTVTHPSDIPVQRAQEIKRETGREVRERGGYGEISEQQRTQNLKALERGLKETIEAKHPEVAPLNAAESRAINVRNLVEDRLGGAGNATHVGWGRYTPEAIAGRLAGHSELLRSLMAHLLYKSGRVAPHVGTSVVMPGGVGGTQWAEKADEERERKRLAKMLKGNN